MRDIAYWKPLIIEGFFLRPLKLSHPDLDFFDETI
jgi:hypothetical protein